MEDIIVQGLYLRKYVVNCKNCVTCNLTKGILLKPKSSFVDLDLFSLYNQNYDIYVVLRKISGNGIIYSKIDNFYKKIIVNNTVQINIPSVNNIISFHRNNESIGEVSIVSICYRNKSHGDLMSVVKNKKLSEQNQSVSDFIYKVNKVDHFSNEIDEFVKKINNLGQEHFQGYGEKKEVVKELISKAIEISNVIYNLEIPQCDYAIFHYAGIGDTIHSRLVAEQFSKKGKVVWIVTPTVYELYKDDPTCIVLKNFEIRFRNPWNLLCKTIYNFVDEVLRKKYPNIINIGHNLVYHLNKVKKINWKTLYFDCIKQKRNFNIKHSLVHNGQLSDIKKDIPKKFVVIEYCSLTFGSIDLSLYKGLIEKLETIGIGAVYIGGLKDTPLGLGIDCRGLSLYDTYTLIKNSVGMIGRNSGNQTTTVFCPQVPVFEVGVPSLKESKYRDNIYSCSTEDFQDFIFKYYERNHSI